MFRIVRASFLVMVVIAVVPLVVDAVLVAPHAVFMDHKTRSGQFTLANPTAQSQEIEIDLQFGYPATDSAGAPYVELIDDPAPDQPSAADWIRAFPKRLHLAPGQRQVVRLLATPPSNLPDGEYWSRIIVTSRRQSALPTAGSSVSASLIFELRTVISLSYRKGEVQTAPVLHNLDYAVQGDSLVMWLDLDREGNAAYLGQLDVTVTDTTGVEVTGLALPIAVYYPIRRRIAMPLGSRHTGPFAVTMELTTNRQDLPPINVLPAPSIARSFVVSSR